MSPTHPAEPPEWTEGLAAWRRATAEGVAHAAINRDAPGYWYVISPTTGRVVTETITSGLVALAAAGIELVDPTTGDPVTNLDWVAARAAPIWEPVKEDAWPDEGPAVYHRAVDALDLSSAGNRARVSEALATGARRSEDLAEQCRRLTAAMRDDVRAIDWGRDVAPLRATAWEHIDHIRGFTEAAETTAWSHIDHFDDGPADTETMELTALGTAARTHAATHARLADMLLHIGEIFRGEQDRQLWVS